jgi:prepilin-type N-terminal cleavage/methylation domain-containing protein
MPTSSVGKTEYTVSSDEYETVFLKRQARRPVPLRAGITLIEMVVVMSIIGLIAGISFPSISAGLDSVRMVSATDSVAAFLNSAVNRAQRRQQPIGLAISPREGLFTLYSSEPGFKREIKVPDGIAIVAILPQTGEPDGPRHFLFMPGATMPGIGIHLANRRGTHRIVRLDPMTGFPRVESVTTK